jgi:hypothetical protein
MMNEEEHDMLVRIDERVHMICEAKLIPRMNRLEGGVAALVAVLTIAGGVMLSSYLEGPDEPEYQPPSYVTDTNKG